MNERQDDKLIASLAASFGMGDGRQTKYSESQFDAATGTLYCEGITVSKKTVEKAKDYFERQKEFYKKSAGTNDSSMDYYLMNTVAYNAIDMLIKNIKE